MSDERMAERMARRSRMSSSPATDPQKPTSPPHAVSPTGTKPAWDESNLKPKVDMSGGEQRVMASPMHDKLPSINSPTPSNKVPSVPPSVLPPLSSQPQATSATLITPSSNVAKVLPLTETIHGKKPTSPSKDQSDGYRKLSKVGVPVQSPEPLKTYRLFPSSRILVALVGSLGFVNLYALKAYLSLAVVCMMNNTAIAAHAASAHINVNSSKPTSAPIVCEVSSHKQTVDGPFIWTSDLKGIILGAFFYGYILTQLIGGYMAEKYGGKRILGWFLFVTIAASFLIPVLTKVHYAFLIILRILQGVGEGVVFPAAHALFASWAPPFERSTLIGITYAGAQMGSVVAMPVSGALCMLGWDYIFYFFGCFGIVWFILWMFLVSDNPHSHARIDPAEKSYIEETIGDVDELKHRREMMGIPWTSIFTSIPVWGIIIAHTTSNWGTYLMLTSIPTYMSAVLKFDIHTNGGLSALPYLCFWGVIVVSSYIADKLRLHGYRTTIVRKTCYFWGSIVPAGLIILMTFLNCSQAYAAVGVMIIGVGFFGLQYPGCMVNHADIAPPFSGILFGISNTFATIPGIIAPYVVGILAPKNTVEEWQLIAYITAVILMVGAILFILMASGEVEDFAKPYMVEHNRRVSSLAGSEVRAENATYMTNPHRSSLGT